MTSASDVIRDVLSLVREHYQGFGPTMVSEKLLDRHGHKMSVEALRKWMIEGNLWPAKRRAVSVSVRRDIARTALWLATHHP